MSLFFAQLVNSQDVNSLSLSDLRATGFLLVKEIILSKTSITFLLGIDFNNLIAKASLAHSSIIFKVLNKPLLRH